ncbi:MAG: LemA family protein [Candidatus Parcubacteria bacterium]|nr:MAG: LemA family protein [Candidatus Parcubacteria bacterium]
MQNTYNMVFIFILIILILSGFLNVIPWKFNIPALIAGIILWLIIIYNSFVSLNQRVKEAESDIEVQMKRRSDLIPNLIETVKGYVSHEKTLLENITQARTSFLNAKNIKEEIEADNMITSTLKTLFAVAENYPDLKANQNFIQLQQELRDTEDKIMSARRFYNAVVMEYNSFLNQFPNNLFKSLFKFKEANFFDIQEEEKQIPKVKF